MKTLAVLLLLAGVASADVNKATVDAVQVEASKSLRSVELTLNQLATLLLQEEQASANLRQELIKKTAECDSLRAKEKPKK